MKIRFGWEYLSIGLCLVWQGLIALSPFSNAAVQGWAVLIMYLCCASAVFKKNKKLASPFFLFVIYCFASNAGQTFTHLLGIQNDTNVDIYSNYSETVISEMLLLQGLFIAAMVIGYLLVRQKKRVIAVPQMEKRGKPLVFGWQELLLVLLALFVGYTYLRELTKRISLSYGDYFYSNREGLGTVMQFVYHVYMFAYLFRNTGANKKFAYAIIVVLAVLSVVVGSRSTTIPMLVGCLYIVLSTKKKIRIKPKYIVFAVLILMVFSAFADLRNYSIAEIDAMIIIEAVFASPLKALSEILQEMGTSARTVLSTMEGLSSGVVEHENTILFSLLEGVLPVRIIKFLGISPPRIESLSSWVSEYGSGPYILGRGWGYSIIAEIIYNYGYWGVLFSFIFGMAMAGAENGIEKLLKKKNYFLASAILYVLCYGVFLARAEMSLMSTRIRYTVYLAIGMWLYRKLIRGRRVRRT